MVDLRTGTLGRRAVLESLEARSVVVAWTPHGNVEVRWLHGRLEIQGRPAAVAHLRDRIERRGDQLPLWGCADG